MVDVGDKAETTRTAVAEGFVAMQPQTLKTILDGNAKKGDVLATARIAGIMAAKKTAELIPLCHPIALSDIQIAFTLDDALPGVWAEASARTTGPTGVEMEAITAVSVSLITIYDMAKGVDKGMELAQISLVEKRGGKSGDWVRT